MQLFRSETHPRFGMFEDVADLVIESRRAGWRNAKHGAQWTATLQTYASSKFGAKPIAEMTTADVLAVLTTIWTEKPETASRVRHELNVTITEGFHDAGIPLAAPSRDLTLRPADQPIPILVKRDGVAHS